MSRAVTVDELFEIIRPIQIKLDHLCTEVDVLKKEKHSTRVSTSFDNLESRVGEDD